MIFVFGNRFSHSPEADEVSFIILDVTEVFTVKPEEHNGFMITDSPGGMFKATKIVPSALFKHPLHACSAESLKTAIDYELKRIKPINRNKPVDNNIWTIH